MEKLNVPKLRFGEFEKAWVFKKVGKIAELTSSKRVYLTDYVERGIPFYRGKEITELKLGRIPNDILYITESTYRDFKKKFGVPQKDDLLITAVGTLGNVLRIKDDSEFYFKDGNLIWIRKINEFSPFLEIALDVYKREIEKTSIGSTQRALTMVELRKLDFPFPTLPEQQKIASFLTTVDDKIQLLNKKKQLLDKYKKGVMHKLFNQEIRFKDDEGNDYPDWEEKSLGEVLDFEQPSKYLVSSTEYNDRYSTPVVTAGKTFILGYTDENFGIYTNLPVIIFDDFTTATQFVDFPFKAKSSAMKILKGRALNDIKFLYEAMQNIDYEIGGHGRHWISIFSKIDVLMPHLPEQNKIASFLSSLDNKISSINQQITHTQAYKKGLLQQMFV